MKWKLGLVFALLAPSLASAEMYSRSWDLHHQASSAFGIHPETTYITSNANFESDGTLEAPAGLNRYSRIIARADLEFGVTDWLTAYLQTQWGTVSVDHTSTGGSAFGFGDQTLGLSAQMLELGESGGLYVQTEGVLPAYNNTASADAGLPFMGDGSLDLTGGLFAKYRILSSETHTLMATGGAGFSWRSSGFSAAIPWSLSARYLPKTRGLTMGLTFHGVQTLSTDVTTRTGSELSQEGAGGSFFINAVNPLFAAIGGSLGYAVSERFSFEAFGGQSLIGASAPHAIWIGLGLRFILPSTKSSSAGPAAMSPIEYGGSNQGFVQYDLDGSVVRVNDRLHLIRIDKGSNDGVAIGQQFDIFRVSEDGKPGEAIARGRVKSVRPDESAMSIIEYFKEVWIEEGFGVKRVTTETP